MATTAFKDGPTTRPSEEWWRAVNGNRSSTGPVRRALFLLRSRGISVGNGSVVLVEVRGYANPTLSHMFRSLALARFVQDTLKSQRHMQFSSYPRLALLSILTNLGFHHCLDPPATWHRLHEFDHILSALPGRISVLKIVPTLLELGWIAVDYIPSSWSVCILWSNRSICFEKKLIQ